MEFDYVEMVPKVEQRELNNENFAWNLFRLWAFEYTSYEIQQVNGSLMKFSRMNIVVAIWTRKHSLGGDHLNHFSYVGMLPRQKIRYDEANSLWGVGKIPLMI